MPDSEREETFKIRNQNSERQPIYESKTLYRNPLFTDYGIRTRFGQLGIFKVELYKLTVMTDDGVYGCKNAKQVILPRDASQKIFELTTV